MGNLTVKRIKLEDIPADVVEKALKERLSFLNKSNAVYWGAYEGKTFLGCTCLVEHKNGTGRIKSNYVLEEYRGKGIFKALHEASIAHAKEKGLKSVYLNCLEDSAKIHVKYGAVEYMPATKTIWYLAYRL